MSQDLATKSSLIIYRSLVTFLLAGTLDVPAADAPLLHCYISTGDNQWLGQSLPIDSPASIAASFDLLHRLGVKRVYWRGLEAATWVDKHRERPESGRYYEFWKWLRRLYREVKPDRLAVAAAHRRGMEIWGVANLVDWGAGADAPPFKHYPFNSESRLRTEHPEWVPTDRTGLLKQGGPIELAYPAARRALVDLHMKFMKQDGYDGMTFLTYAENHSMRFQHEFGYSQPIVDEFKRRHGIDIRYQEWKRFASTFDWQKLRGEFVTQFLRELKAELDKSNQRLGFFLQPWEPHKPQPWNVPELMLTGGAMYFDLEQWIRDGLVDDFLVYGNSNRVVQARAVRNMRWMSRNTPVNVGFLTSGPSAECWQTFQKEGTPTVIAFGEDAMYLDRSFIPEQPMSSLESDDPLLVMKALSQIIYGKSKAAFKDIRPLTKHPHLIVRRLALQALGKWSRRSAARKDNVYFEQSVALIEESLFDPENSIRCMAGIALRDAHGPNSAGQILKSIKLHGNHMLAEIMRVTLPRIRPLPREQLAAAYTDSDSVKVRQIAMRALRFMPDVSLLPLWKRALNDPDRFTRVAAARGIGALRNNAEATELLLETVAHSDPVMANQACVSLGETVKRNAPASRPLRGKILSTLRKRYEGFGDNYTVADADWGYRPVGNALLAFGREGEAILQAFIDQQRDRRLAISAWKSLYIRQKPGRFSWVTEKENEEAMHRRPLFLKRPLVPRIRQNFDDAEQWQPDRRGMVGDVNQVTARWGGLLDKGPYITREDAFNGGQSLLIRRGGASFSGQAIPPVADKADYQLTFQVFRCNAKASLIARLLGYKGSFQPELALNITENGTIRLHDMRAKKWIVTNQKIKERNWTHIKLLANRRAQTYSVTIKPAGQDERSASAPVFLAPQTNLRSIVIYPQPPTGSTVLIDEIELTEFR